MERLVIAQTTSTLGVDFDPHTGLLVMRGESYPENAPRFFAPVRDWLGAYLPGLPPGARVIADLDIIYFNSSSSKVIMDLFDALDDAAKRGVDVNILWRHHVENEIAQECGEEFSEEIEAASFRLMAYEAAP